MKTIIFTDLDGTLLNHHDYSFNQGKDALQEVSKKQIPLVFTTSKTKIEVELLQKEMGLKEPFIIENGAAIFIPKDYRNYDLSNLEVLGDYHIFQLGKTYDQILNFYNEYKYRFGMKGFSDMSDEEVSMYTGLDKTKTKYCKQRDFTEPFLLEDESKLDLLKNLALTYKIKVTKGGRFYHLLGEKQDKGKAVKKAIEILKQNNKKVKSIALGDGENDLEMLKSVDIPIIIKNHKDEYLSCDIKNIQKSTFKGSKGWNEMVLKNV